MHKLENLCTAYKKHNLTFIKYILFKKNEYREFMKFSYDIRKYINNTNIVENFNLVLEKIRANSGGYFQSVNIAEKLIYLVVKRLHKNVWDKPNLRLKHCEYEIRQKINLTFSV